MAGTNGKGPPAHRHKCAECGERSGLCVGRCLEYCKCLGRPLCPHFFCVKCRDTALVPFYTMPETVKAEYSHAKTNS